MLKVKIETTDFSGTKKIRPPLNRLFWYLLTFGKYGERYHYKHVPMRRYYSSVDGRSTGRHVTMVKPMFIYPDTYMQPGSINCRCKVL